MIVRGKFQILGFPLFFLGFLRILSLTKILYLVAARLLAATTAPMEYSSAKVILSCGVRDFTAGGMRVISEGYKVYENNLRDYFKAKPDTADTYGAFHQTAEALFREHPSFRQRRLTSTQSRMERSERLKPICRQRRRIWRRKLCS